MNEALLHFIWKFRYYYATELRTVQGESLQVLHPGEHNTHQGPDFDQARILLGQTTWAGKVELHVRSSDWNLHGHQHDPQYDKVILHVVWHHDMAQPPGGMPLLELQHRVPSLMLDQYATWMHSQQAIPCGKRLAEVSPLVMVGWLDRLLHERMHLKMQRIQQHLQQTNHHWEEVCWRMVCRYYGGSTNADSFEQIAESLPLNLLGRHKNQIHQLEALLLGQAGLLHKGLSDHYAVMLYKEYQFLQKKYGLRVINKPPVFMRMRPVNFPTIRLAQLAMLLHQRKHLLATALETEDLRQMHALLQTTANDYWHTHYKLDEPSEHLPKHAGQQLADTLLINALCPILFAWGKLNGQPAQTAKAMHWLQQTPAEANTVTRAFAQAGLKASQAFDSQAMLTLRHQYCDARRCLECAAGNALLRPGNQAAYGSQV